jgi:hypothetical protein
MPFDGVQRYLDVTYLECSVAHLEIRLLKLNRRLNNGLDAVKANSDVLQIGSRAAQTGVFDLDIRISNWPFIDVCKSFAAETGLESRNVEKRINAV